MNKIKIRKEKVHNIEPIFSEKQILLLQQITERYNISLDDVLNEEMNMRNQLIIEKHINSFSTIWQAQGSDSRWKTYLPDANSKSKRKLIACSTRENLEKRILDYYKQNQSKALQFQTLYFEWLNLKRLEVSKATIERINSSYLRFYKNHSINEKSIKTFSYLYVKEFLLTTIKEYDMNYKQYCNFSSVLRGVIEYAIDKELIDRNPFDRFKLGKNTLRSPDNKSSQKEVFTIEERKMIEDAIWNDYVSNPKSTVPLAVLLDFYTGLRSGELVTLTWNDIQGNQLHIHRTETSYTVINSDGSKGKVIYEVKESPKSDAGIRDVELIPKAMEVLNEIKKFNKEHDWDNQYIFLDDNKRIIRKRLDTQIRKYCKMLNIEAKSMHKIRKYYISALKSSNVEDNEIKRLAGHKDLTTTFNSYCFSVRSHDETRQQLISAL